MSFKMAAHYWLSIICEEMKEYDQEIMQLNVSKALTMTGVPQLEEMIICYRLANAYSKKKMFNESEEEFNQIITNAERLKNNNELNINTTIGEGLRLSLPLGLIIISTRLELSLLYANKSIKYVESPQNDVLKNKGDYPKLDVAFDLASGSTEYIDGLKNDEYRKEYRSAKEKCLGWIWYKKSILGKPDLAEDRINKAIDHLERSINLMSDRDAYLYLAKAYKQKLEILNNGIIQQQAMPQPAQTVATQPPVQPQPASQPAQTVATQPPVQPQPSPQPAQTVATQPPVQPQPAPQPAQTVATQPPVQPQPAPQPAQTAATQPLVQQPQASSNLQEKKHLMRSIEQCYNYVKEIDIDNEFFAELDEIKTYIESQKSNAGMNKPKEKEQIDKINNN
jgi:tetratricopeptide (TPR) repeat protein